MSANMQISNMMGVRPAEVSVPGQVAGPQVAAFGSYTTGQTVPAEVVSVGDETANIQLPNGKEVQMQLPQGVPAQPGDTVDITVVSKNQNMVQLKLEAINGQSVHLEASNLESYLMDRGIPPTQLNEAAAQVFIRNQITPTPRNVANLIDIAANLPEVPTSVALVMAENNVPPTKANADILMKWSSGPAMLGGDIAELEGMVARDSGVARFVNALQSNIQHSATPQQATAITQAPGFEQLAQQLSGMTGQDSAPAQQAIQNFVATLDLPPQEQQAVQNLLTEAFAATAEQFGDPVQTQPQQPGAAQEQSPVQQAQTAPGGPAVAEQPAAQNAQGSDAAANTARPATPAEQPAAQAAQAAQSTPETAQAQSQPRAIPVAPAQGQPEQPAATGAAASKGSEAAQAQDEASAAPKADGKWTGPRRITMPGTESEQPRAEAPASGAANRSESAVRHEGSQILSNLQKFIVRTKGGEDSVREDGQALEQGVRQQRELANLTKAGVSKLFGQETAAAGRANDVSNQVRLGSQMDQFFYAQIPYETREMKGTADLYVLQRKPQKADAEKTHITVLIGLDTQHMGRVESVLRSADDRLSVEFRVSTKRVQTFFEDSIRSFTTEMKESGFPLDSVRVTQIREKTTPVNAMKVLEPKQEIRLQGLDIEA